MFHNSPNKFPQFFKPSVVFPMGLLLSRCKLMSPSCRCHCFKHSRWIQPTEPRQRHGCKSSSEPWHTRHVFPSIHTMEVTEVPWKGKGVKMPTRFFEALESTWINVFFFGGAVFNIHPWIHISILIYLICLLFRFLFSSPWRVLVALEISACVEGHGYMESDIKILRILDWHRLVLLRSDICWTNTASVLSLSLVCQKSQNDSATGHKNQRHTGQLRGSNVQFSWGSLIVHCLVYGTTPP